MIDESGNSRNIPSDDPGKARRKPLRLPFTNRRQDAGEWAFDHRIGLCVTLIVYLVIGIAFISSKIVMNSSAPHRGILLDLQNLEVLENEKDRLMKELERKNSQIDWNSIRNVSSNENALNENLSDAKGTNAAELNAEAEEIAGRLRSNRESYEKGLKDARRAGEREDSESTQDRSDVRVKGTVTVSFSFKDPVRYSRHLVKPAYRCEGGGEVILSVALNRAGKVVRADVVSGGDECMRDTAIRSALESTFDINESAPQRQEGTITYVFIPQ